MLPGITGIIGLIIGAIVVFFFLTYPLKRKLENEKQKTKQAKQALKESEYQIEELQAVQSQIQSLEQTHQKRIQDLEQSYQAQIQELQQSQGEFSGLDNQSQIHELQGAHQTEIETIEQSYQTQIQNLQQAHRAEIEQLQQTHQTQLQEIEKAHQSKNRETQSAYQSQILEIEETYLTQIENLQKQLKAEPSQEYLPTKETLTREQNPPTTEPKPETSGNKTATLLGIGGLAAAGIAAGVALTRPQEREEPPITELTDSVSDALDGENPFVEEDLDIINEYFDVGTPANLTESETQSETLDEENPFIVEDLETAEENFDFGVPVELRETESLVAESPLITEELETGDDDFDFGVPVELRETESLVAESPLITEELETVDDDFDFGVPVELRETESLVAESPPITEELEVIEDDFDFSIPVDLSEEINAPAEELLDEETLLPDLEFLNMLQDERIGSLSPESLADSDEAFPDFFAEGFSVADLEFADILPTQEEVKLQETELPTQESLTSFADFFDLPAEKSQEGFSNLSQTETPQPSIPSIDSEISDPFADLFGSPGEKDDELLALLETEGNSANVDNPKENIAEWDELFGSESSLDDFTLSDFPKKEEKK